MRVVGKRGAAAVAVVAVMLLAPGAAALATEGSGNTDTPPSSTTPPPTTTDPGATDPPTTAPPTTTVPITPPPTTTVPPTTTTPVVPQIVSPALTVTPDTGLLNLQTVTVAGTGFTPNVQVGWAECKNTNGTGTAADCDLNHVGYATTNSSGAFSASFVVHRIVHAQSGTLDCASAVDACTIGGAKLTDYSESAFTPINFDPTAPLPPPPVLIASPTTSLVDGQSVLVLGTGYPASTGVVLQQCVAGTQQCAWLGTASTNANGTFLRTVSVHRTIVTPPVTSVDCAGAVDTCELVAFSFSDLDATASLPLEFDPNGPAPTAAITVTPNTGLVQYQQVTVNGTGFAPGSFVQLIECKTDATSYQDCTQGFGGAPINNAGTLSAPFTVRRLLHIEGSSFDCASATEACSIYAFAYGLTTPVLTSAPISFDAGAPLPPPPAITVTPHDDLVHGQQVDVAGTGFAPNISIGLIECKLANGGADGCTYGSMAQVDSSGNFDASYTVSRGILLYSAPGNPTVFDCVTEHDACSIAAYDFSDYNDAATAPVNFDPNAPIPTPTVTVSPQYHLPDGQIVHVHGTGFSPNAHVIVSECPSDDQSAPYTFGCPSGLQSQFVTADGNGVVDTALRVRRELPYFDYTTSTPQTEHCAEAVGTCVIHVQALGDPFGSSDTPLGFDPDATVAPPELTLSPSGPVTDGERITVHGSGFTPNAVLGLGECLADGPHNSHNCDSTSTDATAAVTADASTAGEATSQSAPGGIYQEFRADQNGEFTRTITVHSSFGTTDGTVSCSDDPNGCVLLAGNRNDWGAEWTTVPLAFDHPTTEAPPANDPPDQLPPVDIPASSSRGLAFTGNDTSVPLAWIGGVAVVLGFALLLLARRSARRR